jgi:predicted metal-binding protein
MRRYFCGQNSGKMKCCGRLEVAGEPRESEALSHMAKRRGNPNWGKPEPIGPVVPTITSFEQVVKEYKLTPDQYVRSTRLREWARRNKNSKYIPEALLEAWGFEIESTL